VALLVAFLALLLWMAFAHGYYRPRREGLQFGVGPLLPVLIPCASLLVMSLRHVAQVLFRGRVGLWVRDGRLHFVDGSISLGEVASVAIHLDRMFADHPGRMVFKLKDGRRKGTDTLLYRTSAQEMAARLEAVGLTVRWVGEEPPDEGDKPR